MLTILLTGFEPFAGAADNPSRRAVLALAAAPPPGTRIVAAILPVRYASAAEALRAAVLAHRPDVLIATGLAGGRAEISVERVAINVDDARIPDNSGRQPIDAAVEPGGPAAYFSTLPIKAIARDVGAAGLAASVSNTAGTFVCNHVFYALMHRLAMRPGLAQARGGFVHVPHMSAMALADQVAGIRQVLRTAVLTRDDVRETAGREH